MKKLVNINLLCLLIGLVTGCANLNEGAVDYRVEHEPHEPQVKRVTLENKYKKIRNSNAIINKGDTITVDLKQVFIKDFSERFSLFDLAGKRGEIAVVAKVFEMSNASGKNKIDFGPNTITDGRVVFFSSDVRESQYLNQSQIPIFGPLKFEGNRFVIQLFVVEIDSDNAQISSLLSTLAGLGSKAYPPASPVLKALEALGSALIKANKNDIEFVYNLTLLPDQGSGYAEPGILAAGNYVFARKEDRTEPFPWDNLKYNDQVGRLVTEENIPYTGESYVVIQIDKGYEDLSLEIEQATLSILLAELNEEKASDMAAVSEIAGRYANTITRIKNRNKGKAYLRKLQAGNLLESEAQAISQDLVALLADGVEGEKVDNKEAILERSDLDSLLQAVRRLTPLDFDDNKATLNGLFNVEKKMVPEALRKTLSEALRQAGSAPAGETDKSAPPSSTASSMKPRELESPPSSPESELREMTQYVMDEKLIRPLRKVGEGGQALVKFEKDFFSNFLVRIDFAKLREKGLIQCESEAFSSCIQTNLGKRVDANISSSESK